jgi:hypothetical protein
MLTACLAAGIVKRPGNSGGELQAPIDLAKQQCAAVT